MRIEFTRVASVSGYNAYRAAQPAGQGSSAARPRGDAVQFSPSVTTIRAAQAAAAKASDIRAERVSEIRTQVQEGTYQVNAQKVAEKLLNAL